MRVDGRPVLVGPVVDAHEKLMNESGLRDELAMERTRLANERTLLAYVRTALALAAAGAAVLHFYADEPTLVAIAWLLVVGAVASSAIGMLRFVSVRRRIERSGAGG